MSKKESLFSLLPQTSYIDLHGRKKMKIGMLWWDNTPLLERLTAAMDYYMKKYHMTPNYCEVNLKEFVDGEMPCEVVANRYILPCHIWIGVKELSSNSNVDTV